jgi:hypothetical protein
MPRPVDRPPRFTTELSEELYARTKAIPWGMRRSVMECLISEVLELFEKYGNVALAALVAGDYKLLDVIMKKGKEEASGNPG